MSFFQKRDTLDEMIKHWGAVLARVMTLRRQGKHPAALVMLDGARQDTVGIPRMLLEQLDAASAADLIKDPNKIRIWARIVHEEALISQEQGQDSTVQALTAVDLLLEATSRSTARDEDRALAREWAAVLPDDAIGPVTRSRLDTLLGPLLA